MNFLLSLHLPPRISLLLTPENVTFTLGLVSWRECFGVYYEKYHDYIAVVILWLIFIIIRMVSISQRQCNDYFNVILHNIIRSHIFVYEFMVNEHFAKYEMSF